MKKRHACTGAVGHVSTRQRANQPYFDMWLLNQKGYFLLFRFCNVNNFKNSILKKKSRTVIFFFKYVNKHQFCYNLTHFLN